MLTVENETENPLKAYWLNYDGDPELFSVITPGGTWTVDTYESHPWRFVDATSNAVLEEYVSTTGIQLLRVDGSSAKKYATASSSDFEGFDGVGGKQSDYASAKLQRVSIGSGGGVAELEMEGYEAPLRVGVGIAEAAALLYAASTEQRRPSTVGVWQRTLVATGAAVERSLVTRLVGDTYYARIVLRSADGGEHSVDCRPSDSVALAMQWGAPVYVSHTVARSAQEEARRTQRGELAASGAPRLQPPSAAWGHGDGQEPDEASLDTSTP